MSVPWRHGRIEPLTCLHTCHNECLCKTYTYAFMHCRICICLAGVIWAWQWQEGWQQQVAGAVSWEIQLFRPRPLVVQGQSQKVERLRDFVCSRVEQSTNQHQKPCYVSHRPTFLTQRVMKLFSLMVPKTSNSSPPQENMRNIVQLVTSATEESPMGIDSNGQAFENRPRWIKTADWKFLASK